MAWHAKDKAWHDMPRARQGQGVAWLGKAMACQGKDKAWHGMAWHGKDKAWHG